MSWLNEFFKSPQNLVLVGAVLALCGFLFSAIGLFWLIRSGTFKSQQMVNASAELNEKTQEIERLDGKLAERNAEFAALRRDYEKWFTGGDSFCYVSAPFIATDSALRSVVHQGRYPLYDVELDITGTSNVGRRRPEHVQIGYLYPNSSRIFGRWRLPSDRDDQDYAVKISARNGSVTQQLKFRRIDGAWKVWTRVVRNSTGGVLLAKTGFSLDEHARTSPNRPEDSGGTQERISSGVVEGQAAEAVPVDRWTTPEKALPDFELEDVEHRKWSLTSLKGKTVLINVWATWCESCVSELPKLQRLYELLKKNPDVALLTLNIDQEAAPVVDYLKKNRYTFPVLFGSSLIGRMFDAISVPRNWIVDANGVLRWEQIGFDLQDAGWETGALQMLARTQQGAL